MKFSGKQLETLEKALIDAFPDRASLERMLLYKLDKNLNQVAGDRDLATVVFNLIKAANAEGWIKNLVCEASQYNSGNILLQAIATELLTNNPTTTPDNSSKKEAIAKYRKKVEEFLADDGEISFIEYEILKSLQEELRLTEEEARAVREEVLKPCWLDKENLDKYKQVFTQLVYERGYPLSQKDKAELQKLQEFLKLKDEDIALLFQEAEQEEALDLSSQKGIDYTKLRNLLKAGQWKEADYETYLMMLQAVGRKKDDWIRSEELLNFPCTDLRTIDRLWVKYSNGRFGFSVQKQIYLEVGGVPDSKYYEEAWKKFGDAIGWRVKESWINRSQVRFNTTAPRGHLPSEWVIGCDKDYESLLSHRDL
ncbi:GUN4 domain-containing protein [Kalymmatonema gypsitolerans NIES-4073]|nr:GUN4 domain-containing protein [Scytonema sp. NIES-4073]